MLCLIFLLRVSKKYNCNGGQTFAKRTVDKCHGYENELQWPNSFSPALSRKPGPGPWTPACAGATVERRPHFIVLRGLRKAIVILSAAEESTIARQRRPTPSDPDPSTSLRVT